MKVNDESQLVLDDFDMVVPPWIAFPDVDPMDMFWRMGRGETYLESFFEYYENLSDKKDYEAKFPAENEWKGFYD